MVVTVTKKALAGALSLVERIIPSRSASPGLSLVRVDVRDDRLTLSGSSMEVDIETTVAGVDARGGEGSFAMPAHVFAQVVRAAPDQAIELKFDKQLAVKSGSFKTNIQLTDPNQAPRVEFPEEYGARVGAQALATSIASVRYAAATADFQAIFRGLALEQRNGKARLVATDGYRLAFTEFEGDLGLEKSVVALAKSTDELVRVIGDYDGEVDFTVTGTGRLSVRGERFRMNLGLMDGQFPDYERVIPSVFPLKARVKAKELVAALNRVSLLADSSANKRVDLLVKDGELVLTAEGPMGRSQETLAVIQEGTDSEMTLAFNASYLTDALSPLDEAVLQFSGPGTPAVFRPADEGEYLAMVVPLRTH